MIFNGLQMPETSIVYIIAQRLIKCNEQFQFLCRILFEFWNNLHQLEP
jgi:hypothetical protein